MKFAYHPQKEADYAVAVGSMFNASGNQAPHRSVPKPFVFLREICTPHDRG